MRRDCEQVDGFTSGTLQWNSSVPTAVPSGFLSPHFMYIIEVSTFTTLKAASVSVTLQLPYISMDVLVSEPVTYKLTGFIPQTSIHTRAPHCI